MFDNMDFDSNQKTTFSNMVSLVMRPTRGDDAAKPKAQVRQAPRPKRKAKARSRLSGR